MYRVIYCRHWINLYSRAIAVTKNFLTGKCERLYSSARNSKCQVLTSEVSFQRQYFWKFYNPLAVCKEEHACKDSSNFSKISTYFIWNQGANETNRIDLLWLSTESCPKLSKDQPPIRGSWSISFRFKSHLKHVVVFHIDKINELLGQMK